MMAETETDPSGYTYIIGTEEEGRTWIGRETELVPDPYPVEVKQVQHYAEGIEDPNPLYWSDEFGKQTRWGGRIAPWGVTVLTLEHQVWRPQWMGKPKAVGGLYFCVPLPGNRLLATDYEIESYVPLRPGDRVSKKARLVDIIPKTFRLGTGHQMIVDSLFYNQNGELCIRDRRTVFRYRQGTEDRSKTGQTT